MDSIKCKCKYWIVYFKNLFLPLPFNSRKVNFHSIFFYCYHWFDTHVRDLDIFFKKMNQKEKYYSEEKQEFEILLMFLNIKMSTNSSKIKLNEELIAMSREKQSIWDVKTYLYLDRSKNEKNLKRLRFFIMIPWRFFNFSHFFKWTLKLHWLGMSLQPSIRCLLSYKRLKTLQWRRVSATWEVFLQKICS